MQPSSAPFSIVMATHVMLSGCLNISFIISQNSIYGQIKTPSLGFLIASHKIMIQNMLGGWSLLDVQQSVARSRCDVFFSLSLLECGIQPYDSGARPRF